MKFTASHLNTWRAQRLEGTLNALGRKRGPKAKKDSEQVELERLQRENERLKTKLRRAEKIIDVQKNLSEVLGLPLMQEDDDAKNRD